jgi:uncharacterized membrane protein
MADTDPNDPRKLLVIDFEDALRANEFLLAATRLQQHGEVTLHDAVFIHRDPDGKSRVAETADMSTGRGAMGGAVWGLLLGTLLAGPIGGLIGGAASAGSGALMAKLIDTGIKDEEIKKLRTTIRPGTTALALLVSHVSVADLQRELARFPGAALVESTLPDAAIAAVRNALSGNVPEALPTVPAADQT